MTFGTGVGRRASGVALALSFCRQKSRQLAGFNERAVARLLCFSFAFFHERVLGSTDQRLSIFADCFCCTARWSCRFAATFALFDGRGFGGAGQWLAILANSFCFAVRCSGSCCRCRSFSFYYWSDRFCSHRLGRCHNGRFDWHCRLGGRLGISEADSKQASDQTRNHLVHISTISFYERQIAFSNKRGGSKSVDATCEVKTIAMHDDE